ncbi:MAG: (deoxy)nucleoside triphosphate pyrophosphohydrolase [Holdemanella sp.]|nr:(deoxy)nucleoside triphosphate pyrophosphohydrolase [Holdemanella sp.]
MIKVVAAIIKNSENKILIAQRNLHKAQGGLWEFPGGKVEANESLEEAIIREIKEELKMDIIFNGYFDETVFHYPDKSIKLIALNCTMIGTTYSILEHEQIAWVDSSELSQYEFAPADIYFVKKLMK